MKKAKEFLCTKILGTGPDLDSWICSADHAFIESLFHQEKFMIIEKSAFNELMVEAKKLRDALLKRDCQVCDAGKFSKKGHGCSRCESLVSFNKYLETKGE